MMQFTGPGPNKVIRVVKDTTNKVKDKVKDKSGQLVNKVKEENAKIVEKLKGIVGTVGDVVEEFTKSEDRNAIPKFVEKEMMQFTGPIDVVKDKTGNIVGKLKDIVGTVGDIVKQITKSEDANEIPKSVEKEMMQFTGPGPNKVIRVVKDTTNKVKDKVKDKSGQLVNKVKEENAKIVEKLKGIVGTVGDVVEEFTKSEDRNAIPKFVEKEMMQFTGPNKVIRVAKDTTNKVKDKVKDKIVEKLKGVVE